MNKQYKKYQSTKRLQKIIAKRAAIAAKREAIEAEIRNLQR
jgi:hypothetical protein